MNVHKSFYASGFLYHKSSQQILLYQSNQKNTTPLWSMIGGEGRKKEVPEKAFQRIMQSVLKIKLPMHKIRPVYDYFHATHKKDYYVFYGELGSLKKFRARTGEFSWFTFKQTTKLPISSETKQDIIVLERVIKAKAREDEIKDLPQSEVLAYKT